MEKEYTFEEYHCAVLNSQLVHRASFSSQNSPIIPMFNKKAKRTSFTIKKDRIFIQPVSNLSSFAPKLSSAERNLDLKKKLTTDSVDNLQETERLNSLAKETVTLAGSMPKSLSMNQNIIRNEGMIESETADINKNLKEKLEESLSPSPFRNEDWNKREARLDQLVTSCPSATRTILLYPFYEIEKLNEAGQHKAWKIALKDHILHTLESICLIKKLVPVPTKIIEKKMLPANTWTNGTFKS